MDKARRAARIAVLLLIVLLAGVSPVGADYDAGQRAWDAGRMDEALSHWLAAADAGDRRAMLALGRLYRQGLGVPQNYVEAHKWLNLAASRGEAAALEERDALAAQMTPTQVAEAQERATQWQPGQTPAGAESSAVRAESAGSGDQAAGKPPPRQFARRKPCSKLWDMRPDRRTGFGVAERGRHIGRSWRTLDWRWRRS